MPIDHGEPDRLAAADVAVLRFLRTRGHLAAGERTARSLSRLGEHGGIWIAIGIAGGALDARRRPRWRRAVGAVAGSYVLNTSIKLAVRRRRPSLQGLPALASTPTQLSFPSAHTSTAFAGALVYSRLGVPRPPLYALALLTAVSRPYLGLHYPSDVLAGALLGSVVGAVATRERRPPDRDSRLR
ncbi:MAG: phosphatase PAP2 family protein [Solirubrobacteraceae bacterium]